MKASLIVHRTGEEEKQEKKNVNISLRKGQGEVLFWIDVSEELQFPVTRNLAVLSVASVRGGARQVLVDMRGEWQARFSNGFRVGRFSFVKYGENEWWELRFLKVLPDFYRLMGKVRNMVVQLESWSVVLPSNPPVTIARKMQDIKPVVEIVTPRSFIRLTREEVFASLAWFDSFVFGRLDGHPEGSGVFYPDPEKVRKLFFGVKSSENSHVEPGLRIYSAEFKDENFFRLFCGLLELATTVA